MRRVIFTESAPRPVGPYSQAVRAGDLVFVAGQVPIDPRTGKVVEGGIREQTRQVLENVKAILGAAGCRLEDVVKVNVYIRRREDFQAMNEVYSQYFGKDPPARTTVVCELVREEFLVEIDAVAVVRTG
ncbi:MAG: Rid family detoxifying hydrolase [Nitrososphaeria archaeon]|nr:Rid family detoxifying hydrolase [Nitrososphaeria archaeon]MDW8043617.1 Rid family detoxifying hydrolase [Nitrososphaerota archaeon]